MLISTPDYYPAGINTYVPAMKYTADIMHGPPNTRINFGAVVLADADGILNDTSIAAAVSTSTFLTATYTENNMGPWGRNITVVASGAATSNVTVKGQDYLGQPMTESFTLNGTTAVTGLKAFKRLTLITAGVTGGTTIDVGFGTRMGLPWRTVAVERELTDNVLAAAGTLTAPVFTDPQTATTGDPRGTYIFTTTPDGVKVLQADVVVNDFVNASGNGGLFGIAHFNS